MDIEQAFENLRLKFTSSNDIPIDRATITREEWEAIKEHLFDESELDIVVYDEFSDAINDLIDEVEEGDACQE